ncbi:MAG TPA: polyprenol phosphomannose-dependent alpha 1,6 mannosyltransferase MptB [Streptosporangiaceae bacterium]|jgi:hypothetical protein
MSEDARRTRVRLGVGGLAAIAVSLGCFLITALLGPSAWQPALPGSPGQPPYALDAHPSPYLVLGLVVAGMPAGAVGLGLCLYAVRRGWSCPARPLLIAGLLVAAAFVFLPPVGSGDHLNYAAYGRMAVTGHDPYITGARDLPGDPIAGAVERPWREEPSIYGPIATAQEAVASWIGGDSVRVTVFVLSLTNALAFALVGLVLYRAGGPSPDGRLRAVLLWTANPLLLFHLVAGAHNDVLAIAAAVCALVVFKAGSARRTLMSGALAGAAAAIKLPAALVGGGPAWVLLRDWYATRRRDVLLRLVALGGAALVVAVAAYALAGPHAFDQVRRAAQSVSLATPWHLVDVALGKGSQRSVIQVGSLVLLVVLGLLLARALPRPVGTQPQDVADARAIAAALVLAWLFAAPYALPWYDALGFALLALLPASAFDWLLPARTLALSLAYLPARDPQVVRLPSNLSWLFTVVRPTVIPWALTVVLGALVVLAVAAMRRAGRTAPHPVRPRRA